ncbi:MAG: hypothetical protein J6B43_12515 [Lachnospiraceae bacterium]|nr:hypothetical protein [Lachnospiraceae bacterium]
MNCLIILLLLFCGGCQNNCGCNNCGGNIGGGSEEGCREKEHERPRCQEGRDRDEDCACGENRGAARHQRSSERGDRDCEQGEPAAWREGREGKRSSYPSISGCETCGCDPE